MLGSPADQPSATATIAELHAAIEFIDALKVASLDDKFEWEDVDENALERLRHPPEFSLDISHGDLRLSIDLFLLSTNVSEENYVSNRAAILRRHPDDEIVSYASIKAKITEMSSCHPTICA